MVLEPLPLTLSERSESKGQRPPPFTLSLSKGAPISHPFDSVLPLRPAASAKDLAQGERDLPSPSRKPKGAE